VRQLRRFERVQQVPAGGVLAVAGQFVEARAAPDVGFDAPVVLEQVGGGDDFAEDGAGAQQLDAQAASPPFLKAYMPLMMSASAPTGISGCS
jgi:hypothetical protein